MGGRQVSGIDNLRHHGRHPGIPPVLPPQISRMTQITTEEGLPHLQDVLGVLLPVIVLISQIPEQGRETLIAGFQVFRRRKRQSQASHEAGPVRLDFRIGIGKGRLIKRHLDPGRLKHRLIQRQRGALGKGGLGPRIGLIHRRSKDRGRQNRQHRQHQHPCQIANSHVELLLLFFWAILAGDPNPENEIVQI